MNTKPKVLAVVGPTSGGKTSLAIALAKNFDGEVISADSRQIYKGLDIATGKVTVEEMEGVPHHLLDVANPDETYTAADFERDALVAIADIQSRGKIPIVTGGTFFYIQLLLGNIQSAPVPPDEEFRAGLENLSNDDLFTYIKASDPARAKTIDSANRQRLVRALEIIDALGVVPVQDKKESPYDWLLIGTDVPKEQLHKNINIRLKQRINDGMIEETENLHKNGLSYERMDELGLEYRYLAKYLQREITEEEMFILIETKNKQYTKRQMTWLKREESIKWFSPTNLTDIFTITEKFLH